MPSQNYNIHQQEQCWSSIVSASLQRLDVRSKLMRHCLNVKCLLGFCQSHPLHFWGIISVKLFLFFYRSLIWNYMYIWRENGYICREHNSDQEIFVTLFKRALFYRKVFAFHKSKFLFFFFKSGNSVNTRDVSSCFQRWCHLEIWQLILAGISVCTSNCVILLNS